MKKILKEYLPFVILIALILVIKSFVVTTIRVNGNSMYPTLKNNDIMLLNKIGYRFSEIERFDIVVVQHGNSPIIKRVIGLPGEVVEYNDNYKLALYINPYKTNFIKNNNSLIIDNKYYEYKIDFIEKDYIISESMNQYIKIYIDIDLKSSDKINNNILQVKILESDQKIICYLKNYIKKGVKKWKK